MIFSSFPLKTSDLVYNKRPVEALDFLSAENTFGVYFCPSEHCLRSAALVSGGSSAASSRSLQMKDGGTRCKPVVTLVSPGGGVQRPLSALLPSALLLSMDTLAEPRGEKNFFLREFSVVKNF